MGYKKDLDILVKQVEFLKSRYGFRGLFHFTDFSNLKSIFNLKKLSSRSYCENNKIKFTDGAEHSVLDRASDYVHNCVRFYYRPKTPTLYKNEGIKLKEYCDKVHIPIPVYLIFDEKLIYLDSTEFSNGNATNSEIGKTAKFFKNMDWNYIFHSTWFEMEDRDYIINKRQAELLSTEDVPLSYLKEIVFRCNTDMKRAINIFGYDERYKVDTNLFSDKNFNEAKNECDKNNFIKNYNIRLFPEENAIEIEVNFNKKWKEYSTQFIIYNYKNNIVRDCNYYVWYKDSFGSILANPIEYYETKVLRVEGDISQWNKLEIFVNNIVCIEEYLLKDYIYEYKASLKNNEKGSTLELSKYFISKYVLKLNHKVEIKDLKGNIVYSTKLSFPKDSKDLGWITKFENYKKEWYILNYYIDDILCISNKIDNLLR
ncbi:DarT ssDNA thymidine ADP-ribosyltransferase family protein [Clostridium perfringens]|uniref:DarT ssDNA thymidine ADP-ribosyltransferase family protein n=1 Tax=Clostridium perfringens TaxID=1502 RepID=UPI001CCFD3B4|nr:DarT ssDNA thymidine ADP-ribosyltransferase family protein [Clostridium perfringens]UBK87382.1 DUF4433 domain-containing protein [Clostridium perfringens]